MLKQTKYLLLFSFVITIILVGCGKNAFYEQYADIPEGSWNKDSLVHFKVEVEDTTSFYNFYLHLRNNNDYPYSNFYSFLTLTFPNKKSSKDTLNLPLADLTGKWLGTGIGEIKTTTFLFKERLRFPLKGSYIFTLRQGMRNENLMGITDVGLQVSVIE